MTKINEFNKELKKILPESSLTVLKVSDSKLDICGDLDTLDFYKFLFEEKWIMDNLEKYIPVKGWRYFRLHPKYAHMKNSLRIASTDTGVEKYAPCFDIRQFAIEKFIMAFNMGYKLYPENIFTTAIYFFISALIKRYEDMLINQKKEPEKSQNTDHLKEGMDFWVRTSQNLNKIREDMKASSEKPKYTCIITSEPDGPRLAYISDHPWEGNLEETIQFNTIEELFDHDVEGLFYQLFDNESGQRLGYGMIDCDYPATDIQDFEKKAEQQEPSKYTCIVTRDPIMDIDSISHYPWSAFSENAVQFDTIEELFKHDVKGLCYQLFDNESGKRIGHGIVNSYYPGIDIRNFEEFSEKGSEQQGHLIVISGFSRAGKNAIADGLKELSDNYIYSISATTRQPRPDEHNEIDYHFITPECFENIKESGGFLETAEYCGNSYGTLALPVTKALKEGRDMVLVLETEGAMKVKELFPTAITFFVAAPAADLKSRMKETGISEDDMKKRLAEIRKEISMIPKYDYLIMNENGKLEKNIELVHNIIKGYKSKTSENLGVIEALHEEFC